MNQKQRIEQLEKELSVLKDELKKLQTGTHYHYHYYQPWTWYVPYNYPCYYTTCETGVQGTISGGLTGGTSSGLGSITSSSITSTTSGGYQYTYAYSNGTLDAPNGGLNGENSLGLK